MPQSSVFAVINPWAGRGRGGARIARFRELLDRHAPGWVEGVSERPGHESELADRALAEGYERIVAIGGDGTWSLVADRILRSGRDGVQLGLLPAGTGNDFGKTLGITWDRAEDVVRAIAAGRHRRIDVGRVGERHFLNVVGLGFDIAVIEDAEKVSWLKGDALYQFCALRQLFRFPGLSLGVAHDASPPERVRHLMLTISNARYFGGSFHIAPGADLTDGRLDVVSIHDTHPIGRARLFRSVGKGSHVGHPKVRTRQSERFTVELDPPLKYEMDGEVYTTHEPRLVIEAVPLALDLLVPEGEA